MSTLTVRDESTTGDISEPITLEFLTDHITVRELIRERVYQEVKDYNANQGEVFKGLIQPSDAEIAINGFKIRKPRHIDWQPQFQTACDAFTANQVLILIDDHQAQSLEEQIVITPRTEVSFLKLVPLVGG